MTVYERWPAKNGGPPQADLAHFSLVLSFVQAKERTYTPPYILYWFEEKGTFIRPLPDYAQQVMKAQPLI
jgi:hypothetical protein